MLERIGSISPNISFMQVKNQPVENTVSNPIQSINFKGLDALASYNSCIIKKNDDFEIPVVEKLEIPKNIESIEGEHIYNSSGELVCVIKEDKNEKYIYHNDKEKLIEVFDKNSNEKIKEQTCFNNLDNEYMVSVVEFVSNKKDSYQTFYKIEGNKTSIEAKSKNIHYADGTYKEFIYYPEQKEYHTIEHSNFKNTNWLFDKSVIYDENKNIKSITEHDSNSWKEKEVIYQNGKPYSIEENNVTSIPNDLGKEPMQDPDLQPTPKFETDLDFKNIEGEKTYYSNGVIEKNVTPKGTFYFKYNGDLEKVEIGNKYINIDEYGQEIVESLENGATKTTYYNYSKDRGNGQTHIKYEKDNTFKELSMLNGNPVSYSENINGKGWTAEYSQDGSLLTINESTFL